MNIVRGLSRGFESLIEFFIFASRWFQAPIYLGLIFGSGLYVYKFLEELVALAYHIDELTEVQVMLTVLGLIDISMVMNLLIIVIIGGYSIFTSRIDFEGQEDRPQWIDHLDADRLKVKLATSLASISGVHLLKTFIDIHSETNNTKGIQSLQYEIVIHMIFIISALILAWIARILDTRRGFVSQSPKTN
ncbi:MAG: TIGR00645 family protein [Cyclobacteriaceae bacterium]|nr:TIGR00645 family protein [Cyclobacteriaceae bacterium]